MGSQRKHSDLPPTPPGHPPPSMATDEASSSSERSNQRHSTQPASFNSQPPSRRKKPGASKNLISEEETQKKYGQFHSVFESISLEKKKSDFLVIRIQELRDYLRTSFKNDSRLVLETFDEAIKFGKTNQNDNGANWGFWVCPRCKKKFTDDQCHFNHLLTQHGKRTKLAREVCLPPVRWIDMVDNKEWKPVDVSAALQEIEDNPHLSDDELLKLELPLSNDNKRASLLKEIREILKYLLRTESFPESNLTTMMGFICEELKISFSKSKHEAIEKISQLGLCFMFLDAPQLASFLLTLRMLRNDCFTVEFPDIDGFKKLEGRIAIQETIDFSKDWSCLVLDERLLTPSTIVPQRYLLPHPSVSGFQIDDAFVDWLLCSASVREELNLWVRLKADISDLGSGFLDSSYKAWKSMDLWAQESMKCSKEEKEWRLIEAICAQEDDARINDPTHAELRYESMIRGLLEHNLVELETVRTIIHDVQKLDVVEEFRKCSPWTTKWLDDIINSDDPLRHQDAIIRIALHNGITTLALQQCRVDSVTLRMESLKKTVCERFEQACGLDYRAILLPFVKSFLQEQIEKPIREVARKTAEDAAAKFLKELDDLEEKNKKQDPPGMGKKNNNEKKGKAKTKRRTKKDNIATITPSVAKKQMREDSEQKAADADAKKLKDLYEMERETRMKQEEIIGKQIGEDAEQKAADADAKKLKDLYEMETETRMKQEEIIGKQIGEDAEQKAADADADADAKRLKELYETVKKTRTKVEEKADFQIKIGTQNREDAPQKAVDADAKKLLKYKHGLMESWLKDLAKMAQSAKGVKYQSDTIQAEIESFSTAVVETYAIASENTSMEEGNAEESQELDQQDLEQEFQSRDPAGHWLPFCKRGK